MPVGIQSDGLPRPATVRGTAILAVGLVARRCRHRSGSCDFSEAAELPIGDSARRAPLLTRGQAQIGLKFLSGRGEPPREGLMENWRAEVLSSTALDGAGRPVTPAVRIFGHLPGHPTRLAGERHGA
jgi:hypothetical protein